MTSYINKLEIHAEQDSGAINKIKKCKNINMEPKPMR